MQKLLQVWGAHIGRWYDFALPIYAQRAGVGFMMTRFWYERMLANFAFGYLLSLFFGKTMAIVMAQPIPFFRIRLWWHQLFIRKDEFHRSLDMDTGAMSCMTEAERTTYQWDLIRRRNIAHARDLAGH